MTKGGLFREVGRILLLQGIVAVVVTLVAGVILGMQAAMSVAMGCVVAWVPNLAFAAKIGRQDPGRTAREVVNAFYLGELIKLVLTASMFVVVFHLPGIQILPLLAGFMSVMVVFWFALLLGH